MLDGAIASPSNLEFSAEAVQRTALHGERRAQMFIGDGKVRIERLKGELAVVEIFDIQKHRAYVLVPDVKGYMEPEMSGKTWVNPMLSKGQSNPCEGVEKASCKRLSSGAVFGRKATRWEMMTMKAGQSVRSLHLIDDLRKIPLHELRADGSVLEFHLVSNELLNGRKSERWEKIITATDGSKEKTTQWYDLELELSVREERANGDFRELRNIRLEPQPDYLFTVPSDYVLVPMSATETTVVDSNVGPGGG